MWQPYPMDKRELQRFNADMDNPEFQKEYDRWREIWTAQNCRNGGFSSDLLFLISEKFQKPRPVVEPEPQEIVKPSANSKPKKELQVA